MVVWGWSNQIRCYSVELPPGVSLLFLNIALPWQVCVASCCLHHRRVPIPAIGGGSQGHGAISALSLLAGFWQPGSSK